MENQSFYNILLSRREYWSEQVANAKKALDAVNALIDVEYSDEKRSSSQSSSATNDEHKTSVQTRREIVLKALKSIGTGTVEQVGNQIVLDNPDLLPEKAKNMARAELSNLNLKGDKNVKGKKLENTKKYLYEYVP